MAHFSTGPGPGITLAELFGVMYGSQFDHRPYDCLWFTFNIFVVIRSSWFTHRTCGPLQGPSIAEKINFFLKLINVFLIVSEYQTKQLEIQ